MTTWNLLQIVRLYPHAFKNMRILRASQLMNNNAKLFSVFILYEEYPFPLSCSAFKNPLNGQVVG